MEMNYNEENSGYKNSLKTGEDFQEFVKKVVWKQIRIQIEYFKTREEQFKIGESKQGIEVKFDNRHTETKRLSIEIAEKTKATNEVWVDSGIYRKDNSWLYIQGNYEAIYFFSKKYLILLHKTKKYKEKQELTLKAFYLPEIDAKKYCLLYWKFNNPEL